MKKLILLAAFSCAVFTSAASFAAPNNENSNTTMNDVAPNSMQPRADYYAHTWIVSGVPNKTRYEIYDNKDVIMSAGLVSNEGSVHIRDYGLTYGKTYTVVFTTQEGEVAIMPLIWR